ncbi:MAG: hypothetical protein WKG03_01650 [Telluria sp.]
MADTFRKPRLTDGILDDLGVAVSTLQGEIEYLDDARKTVGGNVCLQEHFTKKHASLVRARDWLSRHIDATRSQRGATGQDLFNGGLAIAEAEPNQHQCAQGVNNGH